MNQLSREDFFALPLEETEGRTGLPAPQGADEAEVQAYRERAWRSYKLDVANRTEWVGFEGENTGPADETL